MNWLFSFTLVIHILVALAVIGLILIQHGKGADMGAAFGSGASGSLFGASGSANFFSRMTAILATVFFITSLFLGYAATNAPKPAGSIMEGVIQSAPAPGSSETVPEPAVATDENTPAKPREIPR